MKKGRKLGHITEAENRKAQKAIARAKEICEKDFSGSDRVYACRVGADLAREELIKEGFNIPFPRNLK